MDSHHGVESGEMYSPNEQGEYTPEDGAQALTVEPPKEELILQLEVMMADHLGHPHLPHGYSCP